MTYDWKKGAWKAGKAALLVFVGFFVTDASFLPAVIAAVPLEYRAIATILLASLASWFRNYAKNTTPSGL